MVAVATAFTAVRTSRNTIVMNGCEEHFDIASSLDKHNLSLERSRMAVKTS